MPFEIPAELRFATPLVRPAWRAWLDGLPRLVDDILDEWELSVDGAAMHGFCCPGRAGARGRSDALRVASSRWPHDEQEHEHLGLQAWHGDGAVLMYRADPARGVMLLERLASARPQRVSMMTRGVRDHGGLLPAAAHPGASAAAHAVVVHRPVDQRPRQAAGQRARSRDGWSSRRARSVATSWPTPAPIGVMIHGDLHYENVLAADREPWLVIDPKPMSGDGHYEVAPLLWNRLDEVRRDRATSADAVRQSLPHRGRHRRARRGPGPRLGDRPDDPQRDVVRRGQPATGSTPRSMTTSRCASRSPRLSRTERAVTQGHTRRRCKRTRPGPLELS